MEEEEEDEEEVFSMVLLFGWLAGAQLRGPSKNCDIMFFL